MRSDLSTVSFLAAATDEVSFLYSVPQTSDGAISHRVADLELWSDAVYMVPPFLAYFGVLSGNTTMIQAAYDQIRLYQSYLQPNGTGLWTHILYGDYPDTGTWMTGNGWVAGGMLRVYATIVNSPYAAEFSSQSADLASWSTEIVTSAFATQLANSSLLPNYGNVSVASRAFPDAASTAMLAACSYRLAQYSLDSSTLSQAEAARLAVYAGIDSQGILSPVVNPLSYKEQLASGSVSPEAEAFVLMMEAAHRDWVATGANDGTVTVGAAPQGSGAGMPGVSRVGLAVVLVLGGLAVW